MSSNLYQIKKEIPIKEVGKDLAIEIQSHLYRLGYLNKKYITGKIDKETLSVFSQFKKDYGLSHPYLLGRIAARLLVSSQPKVVIPTSYFNQVFNDAKISRKNEFFLPLNRALKEFEMTEKTQIIDFLTVICWESRQLKNLEDFASNKHEQNIRLGNVQRGDSQRYKGRGLIKIVGRDAYTAIGKRLGIKLKQFPTLALVPENACRIACYYWCENNFKELSLKNDFKKIAGHFEAKLINREKLLTERDRIKSILLN